MTASLPTGGQAERWRRIEELFRQALALPPEERAAFVRSRCGPDERDLADEVQWLLAYDAREDGAVDSPAGVGAAGGESSPERVGPYRILRLLGEGLFSQVFQAVDEGSAEAEPVAVKLLRAAGAPRLVRRRFLLERRALGSLDHPNVARLLDGGFTAAGVPYIVMEYVAGVPIDEYCDRQVLSVAQRVALFRQVCAAVEHAHQHFFVHRDLKPTNILVTDSGTPKLLDFGIAKQLDAEGFPTPPALTSLWWRPLTPQYASPEQVGGSPITAASDVYSLGVLLYRLLTGRLPYEVEGASPQEVERIIGSTVPALASVAAAGGASSRRSRALAVPGAGSGARRELSGQLAGDLDRILARALEKEPGRRYPSVERLSEDLRRYLAGEPVEARRDAAWTYRAGKFLRRHRVGLTVAGAFVALLLAFAATMAVQAGRIARERDRAEHIAAFLQQVFEVADPARPSGSPGGPSGREVTARQLLDHGAERVERELADQPEEQAALLDSMGRAFTGLGLYERAEAIFARAVELRRSSLGDDAPALAESLYGLAMVHWYRGANEEAEALHREALRIRRRAPGGTAPAVADSLVGLAQALDSQGRFEEAEALFREALAIRRRTDSPDRQAIATNLKTLGNLLQHRGAYDEAETLLSEALALRRAGLGDDHPWAATIMSDLAILLQRRGAVEEAEALFREALEILREDFGPEHPTLATLLHNLAVLLDSTGDYPGAEALLREALDMRRNVLGDEHPVVATNLATLAILVRRRGDLAEAEALSREALALHRRLLGDEHPEVAWDLHDLADLLAEKGEAEEAEGLYRQALAMRRRLLGDQHPEFARTLAQLGLLLLEAGDPRSAEPLLRQALAIRRLKVPAHPDTAWTSSILGACLTRLGRYDEARPLLMEGHAALGEAPAARAGWLEKSETWLADLDRLAPRGEVERRP